MMKSAMNGQETILVVDDNRELRMLLESALKMFGYHVICAQDGKDGLDKFIEYKDRIRLAILDVVMPNKNGLELYHDIMRLEPGTRVMFMSGYHRGIIDRKRFQKEGVKCISKPFEVNALLKEIRELLDN